MHEEALYTFGPYVLDPTQRVLCRGSEPLRLTPREIDVLVALVERHGQLVEKSRFFDQVWRGLAVEECNLSQHVASLRRVLHDDAREPTYIETVPRRGYRFVAPVSPADRSTMPARTPAPAPRVEDALPAAAEVTVAPHSPAGARPRRWLAPAAIALGALALATGWTVLSTRARSPSLAGRTIVVQPFTNLTGDARHDRIADALTSEMVADLRAVQGLRVELASVPVTEREAAHADLIVENWVLASAGKIRLTAEVIDAESRRLVWADIYETDPVSFLETGDRITREIVSRLASIDAPSSASAASAAHRECVLAREFLNRRTPQVVTEALAHFTAAVELEPGYAPAHVGIAQAYLLGAEEHVIDPEEALAKADAAAHRALTLDPRVAEAHAALGEIAAARWDFDAAEASYRRALELDPSIPLVHQKHSELLTILDRHEQAIAEARVARDLDPTSADVATGLAAAYYHSGQNEAAVAEALGALRLMPRFAAAYDVLGWAYQAKGQPAESVAAFQEAVRSSGGRPSYVAALARAQARVGAKDEARKLLAQLEQVPERRRAARLDVAEVLAALGETEKAVREIERAVAEGAPWLRHVDSGLSLAALHDHERFGAIVARMRRSGVAATEVHAGDAVRPPGEQRAAAAPDLRAIPALASGAER